MYVSVIATWSVKLFPVAYSVIMPTSRPNITHLPLLISAFFTQPKACACVRVCSE